MTHQADEAEAREVLRAVWAAQGEQGADLDEDCSPTKSCKNMREVSFDGLAEPGSDVGDAWRERLAREGKLSASRGSVHDLVFGPAESR
ncbi:MAG TPA: hypothetical protein VGJ03_07860 [Acidimicrobiales bacterium]|jgi:hypothetical protein